MKRKFTNKLKYWKEHNIKMPLMVIGARQIGKTYIIDEFCRENFREYIYINLEKEEKIQSIFENTLDPEEIIKYIEINYSKNIDIENTIIFFDEIQVSERAITSLKYFCESERPYKIVCAGSLLGVKLNRFKSSFPVGKVIIENMYPLDFEEFLLAKGREKLIEEIKNCFNKKVKILDSIHEIAINEYKEYLCIGGMPKAVLNYLENDCKVVSFDRSIHENIINAYIADMRKYVYTAEESIKIQNIYETMPIQLGKDNRKFKYSVMEKGATRKNYELPLDWLVASNMLIKCTKVNFIQVPLKAYQDIESFKMYISDVGLLNYLAKVKFSDIILESEFMFKGAITENYVAQALISKKYDLYYWRSKSEAEVDFVLDKEDGIIPIEVKASTTTKSKSLNEYIQKFNPNYAIRVSAKNFGFYNNIFSVPLYAVFLI